MTASSDEKHGADQSTRPMLAIGNDAMIEYNCDMPDKLHHISFVVFDLGRESH